MVGAQAGLVHLYAPLRTFSLVQDIMRARAHQGRTKGMVRNHA